MEALDRLEARKALRLDPRQVLKPVEVSTFDDIKRLLAIFDPKRNSRQAEVKLRTTMQTVTDSNQEVQYRVEAPTRSKNQREILLDGLNIIKARANMAEQVADIQETVEVNGRLMQPAQLGYAISGASWVDPLIKQWLGGYRSGVLICWNLNDGYTYKYDIYDHKLVRTLTNAEPKP